MVHKDCDLEYAEQVTAEHMMKNPQGCFTDAKGNKVPKKEAEERLETMAQILGELIDTEDDLIKGTMQSDAELRRRRRKNK